MEKLKLSYNNIDQLCLKSGEYLSSQGINNRDITRLRLTIEETLLKYRDEFGEDTEVLFAATKLFNQLRIVIYVQGDELNPFEVKEDEDDILMDSLLQSYDTSAPNWKYKNQTNEIVFNISKESKKGLVYKLSVAILAGSLLGVIARLLPNSYGSIFATDYVAPLCSAFVGLMCVMAVFLTFFAVSLGIVHAGDLSTLSSIGKTLLGRIGKIMLTVSACITLVLIPFIKMSGQIGSFEIKSEYDLLLGFIPSNPILPLAEFNTAQIIIVAAMFGFTMLYLGSKTATLEKVFTEANIVAVTCNSFMNSKLIHFYVGLNFFVFAATASGSGYLQSLKIIVVVLVAFFILLAIYAIIASSTLNISIKDLIHKLMPAFMINISSASYGSSFQVSIETLFACGVDIDYAAVGHNIGGLLFKPAYAILLAVGTMISAAQCGMEINIGILITIFLLSMILAMTLPTIPGSAISGFTLMFAQLGLPKESLALIITLNALLDFFTVAVNGFCLQSEIMLGAKKAGRLDESALGE